GPDYPWLYDGNLYSISQRFQSMGLYIWVAELFSSAIPLRLVTGLTSQSQVGHAIGAASDSRYNVLDLKGHALTTAIGTLPPPLRQQVFAHMVAHQLSPLVLNSRNFRKLHLLRIETSHL